MSHKALTGIAWTFGISLSLLFSSCLCYLFWCPSIQCHVFWIYISILLGNILSLSSALVKKYSQKESPVVLSGYQFIFGGIIMTICGFALGGKLSGWSVSSVLLLIYLALISSVAYSVWGILIKHNPVGKLAIYSFTNPIFSVLLSFVFLGESSSFGIELVLALLLVCAGIYLVNRVKE